MRPARSTLVVLVLTVVALVGSVLPAAAQARDITSACAGAPEDGFTDTGSDGAPTETAIDCIAWYEVTSGATADRYEPSAEIRRAQMATMLAQTMRQSQASFEEPGATEDAFADDEASVHEANINFVAKHGVTQGAGPGRYDPQGFVTRAQMASFLVNQLTAIGAGLPSASEVEDAFTDDDGSTHEDNINILASLAIATGTGDGEFQPAARVTRAQMALFIARDLAELVDQGLLLRPDQRVVPLIDAPELVALTVVEATEDSAELRFAFDEDLVGDLNASAFRLSDPAGSFIIADQVTADGTDAVLATFSGGLISDSAIASVGSGGVTDADENANPEGAFALGTVSLPAGASLAPGLVEVTQRDATTWLFEFDEAAWNVQADGYHLVLDDGTDLVGDLSSGDGQTTHEVVFEALPQGRSFARGWVEAGTVSDEEQTSASGTEGDTNAQQAVGTGLTSAPDLVGGTIDPESDTVTLTFDEPVTIAMATLPPGPAGQVRIGYVDGSEATTSDLEAGGSGDTIVATFPEGMVTDAVVLTSVDAGTVTGLESDEPNAVDALRSEEDLVYAPGITAAPDLVAIAVTERSDTGGTTTRDVTFTFDEAVTVSDASGFAVYGEDGSRTALPGSGVLAGCAQGEDDNTVVCSVNSQENASAYAAVGDAVLGGVEQGAVTDSSDRFPNYASSAPILTEQPTPDE